jgi:hypothetical protein
MLSLEVECPTSLTSLVEGDMSAKVMKAKVVWVLVQQLTSHPGKFILC